MGKVKFIGKVCLFLAVAAIVLLPGIARAGFLLDRVVAVVNEEAITWGELYKAMEFQMARDMQALTPAQKREIFKRNESKFLEQMIDQRLQLQAGRNMGIIVGPGEIDAAIASIKSKFALDDAAFEAAIYTEGFTLKQYRAKLDEQIIVGRVLETEVRSKVALDDKDMAALSDGDAEVRVRQIFLKTAPDGSDVENVQARAERILEQLRGGANFKMLATRLSEGPLAQEGGDFGFIRKSNMAAEFIAALDGLAIGGMSEPFRSNMGIHIIKLEEVKSMKDIMLERRFQEKYSEWLRHLRETAFIEVRL